MSAECADSHGLLSAQKRWLEKERKQEEMAAAEEKSVAALRADLAKPWSSLIIAQRYNCTCTGISFSGFRLKRTGESATVAPWEEDLDGESRAVERVGEYRPISLPEVERLLTETALFYLAASLSVTPREKVGPWPNDPAKEQEWRERYLAAGGSPMGIDEFWIEVRVTMPDGEKRHRNMWERNAPSDFSLWINAFGMVPRKPNPPDAESGAQIIRRSFDVGGSPWLYRK